MEFKVIRNNELYHHGVLGQKWGKRNGPPYPLDDSKHSASEKKAGWKKSLLKKDGLVGEVDPELASLGVQLGIYVAMIAAVLIKKAVDYKHDISENRDNNGKFSDIKAIKVPPPHTPDKDQAAVNKNYGKDLEHSMNCTMCTTAYELRRRGYDVEASITAQGRYTKDAASWFNIDKKDIVKTKRYRELVESLNSQPDGARGNICCEVGPYHSLHSMVWEKEKGKVIIRDCQTNTKYDSVEDSIICKRCDNTSYQYFRTDNAVINEEKIMDAVQPRRG